MQKSATPAKAATVTLRDLGAALAETHGLPKKQVNDMLTGTVEAVGGHLKKGQRTRASTALASCRCASAPPAWAAIPRPARPSRSRPARKSHSAPPRT